MPKAREELRRGVRHLIESTSREMEALSDPVPERQPAPDEAPADAPGRPILRLVRDTARPPVPPPVAAPVAGSVEAAPASERAAAGATAPAATPAVEPAVAPEIKVAPSELAAGAPLEIHEDVSAVHRRKGVCAAYYVDHACWNVPEAFCNQALHVCMLRDCPVYHLHREDLEKRFAAKFSHLW